MKPLTAIVLSFWHGRAGGRFHPVSWLMCLMAGIALGQEPTKPLKPPDRSTPRAALRTFLEAGDAVATFMSREYLPSPSRAEFHHLTALSEPLLNSLDLSQVPPATRVKTGRAAALELYEVLSRIPLPGLDDVPGADPSMASGGTNVTRWRVPDTEIVLVRTAEGSPEGEFLFSPETVAKAGNFYERVRRLPYIRTVPLENLRETVVRGGGWLIPFNWVQAMPAWLHIPLAGQAAWKWVTLAVILGVFGGWLRFAYRLSRRGSDERPFLRALAQVSLPAFLLLAVPVVAYLALVQLNLRGGPANVLELVTTAVIFLSGAWISWRFAPVVAEAIIASPRIAPESIDAHLIRICTRLLGILAGAALLAVGADRLGLPVYGIIAGLGVGGLAIALAAQPTIENLIGGLSLFADKSIRVGDYCRCGTDEGTVETIGIRSTWIRGVDRTLTTIPNAALSKMSVVNFGRRDETLIQSVVGVRYETSPDQLRHLLVGIREMLVGHPMIHHDSVRVRFVGFGASSLDLEVFAYVKTRIRMEFLGIQEDVLLRIMDLVARSGTGFAFPSQTLYIGRDGGLDTRRSEAAEAQVRQWREEGRLPFLDSSPEPKQELRPDPVAGSGGDRPGRRPG